MLKAKKKYKNTGKVNKCWQRKESKTKNCDEKDTQLKLA